MTVSRKKKRFSVVKGYSEDSERLTRARSTNRNTECTDGAAIRVFRSCISMCIAWAEYHGEIDDAHPDDGGGVYSPPVVVVAVDI